MLEPISCRAALGEFFAEAEALGETGEDVVIVARLAIGCHRPMHRDQQRIAGGGADILALQGDRRRQHDIGMAGARRPCRLVDDDRIGARKGTAQPVQVLMVVERVAARPVDQTDVGVGEPLAVIVEGFARVQQHIGERAPPG